MDNTGRITVFRTIDEFMPKEKADHLRAYAEESAMDMIRRFVTEKSPLFDGRSWRFTFISGEHRQRPVPPYERRFEIVIELLLIDHAEAEVGDAVVGEMFYPRDTFAITPSGMKFQKELSYWRRIE
jgi:hypothetical protein